MTREIFGLFLIFWGLFLLLALLTFDAEDPSLNHVTSANVVIENSAGLFGAYLSGFLSDIFGFAAFIWPVLFMALGGSCISARFELRWWRWCGYLLLAICLLAAGAAWDFGIGEVRGGGMLGDTLFANTRLYFSPAGSSLLWIFIVLIAFQLSFDISWISLLAAVAQRIMAACTPSPESSAPDSPQAASASPAPAPWHALFQRFRACQSARLPDLAAFRKRVMALGERVLSLLPLHRKSAEAVESREHAGADVSAGGEAVPASSSLTSAEAVEHREHAGADASAGVGGPASSSLTSAEAVEHREHAGADASAGGEAVPASPSLASAEVVEHREHAGADASAGVGGPASSSLTFAEAVEHREHTGADASAGGEAVPASSSLASAEAVEHREYAGEDVSAGGEAVPASSSPASAVSEAVPRRGVSAVVTTAALAAGAVASSLLRPRQPVPLPGLELLTPESPSRVDREDMTERGRALMACLEDFDIRGELVRITPGPVVTMFELRPAPGIRVSRIANLSDDLALALKAVGVRIQAPIPGTDAVGIEVPNDRRETVNFRKLLESEAFRKDPGPLTMALGTDIAGRPFMADLSRMPHLLVAGATGAGKSVCLNSILMSLLYRTRPEDMQLLLVDPKRIEMAVYADLPHLVHPVVTEMSQAKTALDWAVHEMDQRYEAMARLGVRNISGFNQKIRGFGASLPPEFSDLAVLPYLVIIIDELADLMLTAAREVETSIVRLAQLARAAGIHMILATQRPSVDVVTGLIKANFPCRISFQVTSKHDSRTILDMVGAEYLLGKGDMLFKPSGGRLLRLHGPFVSDEEVAAVVGHWKRQLPPSYRVDFSEWSSEVSGNGSGSTGDDAAQDPLYGDVQAFVNEQGKASISLIQRRFKIGFNRAARLVEQLERDGIIGPADGSKPRAVVR